MDFGAPELIIILVIVILIFGPGRIASLGRDLGQGIRGFREGISTPKEPPENGQTDNLEP
jgi:sec-independent protein translocase protein TatA